MSKKRRGNGEGSIYQRSDGRWVSSVTTGFNGAGRQVRKDYYAWTRAEVVERLDEARKRLAEGLPIAFERQTLAQYVARWLEDVVRGSASYKTFQTYSDLIDLHIVPALGRVDLRKLNVQQVQHFLNLKSEAGLAPATVKHLRDCLRAALNVALEWDLIARNPAALARPPKRIKRKPTVYNMAQARQFVETIEGHRLGTLFLVALCMGMREGEVLALGWEDVDLENKVLTVQHSLQRIEGKLRLVATKTEESRRTIRIPDLVLSSLINHRARQDEERAFAGADWVETGRVFTTLKGTMLDARNMLRTFYSLRKLAQVPHIRFHDLRHSAATLLRAAGVPTPAISKLLGHASTRTTDEVYSHVISEMERAAAEKMDEILKPVAVKIAVKTTQKQLQ